jgi:isopenicillin N synthase-like dioxygenase
LPAPLPGRRFRPETEPAISYYPTPLPEVLPFLNLYGPNLFPKAPEQFKSTYLTYYNASQSLAFQLLNSIARSLTSAPERLTDLFTTPPQKFGAYSRAKVVRYPFVGRGDKYDGLEAEESGLGVGAHKVRYRTSLAYLACLA